MLKNIIIFVFRFFSPLIFWKFILWGKIAREIVKLPCCQTKFRMEMFCGFFVLFCFFFKAGNTQTQPFWVLAEWRGRGCWSELDLASDPHLPSYELFWSEMTSFTFCEMGIKYHRGGAEDMVSENGTSRQSHAWPWVTWKVRQHGPASSTSFV